MYLKKLTVSNFRNYKTLEIEFPAGGAFFEGENGSGKTNILEAIYLLCTGRSQRNAPKSDMVNFDSICATVEGTTHSESGSLVLENSIIFNKTAIVSITINKKKVASLAEWFGNRSVMSFSPDDISLLNGSPAVRRKFIDVLISFFDKSYLNALLTYRKNLSLRNHLLRTNNDDVLCDIYEEKMVDSGAEICQKRMETIAALGTEFGPIYREISSQKDNVFFRYETGFLSELSSIKKWKEVFYTMLRERRKSDREAGFSSQGPHRDDIGFFINGKPAGKFASQGQGRSIVLSIKTGACVFLEKITGNRPLVLFDDAVSELDSERTKRVFSLIENLGQLFIASPSSTMPSRETIRRFVVSGGTVSVL